MKHICTILFVVAALLGSLYLLPPALQVSAQGVSAPATLQTTLGSGATQLTNHQWLVYQVMLQNNGSHTMRCGDSNVTSSRGALLAASGGSINFSSPTYLSQFYCAGTSGDVVDIIYVH